MKLLQAISIAAALAFLLALPPVAGQAGDSPDTPALTLTPGTLTVCLPRNAGVVAGRRMTGGTGFDYRLSKAVAARMGLEHVAIWYENELQEESDPLRETYAMLSSGLCDAIPGHPRYARAVGSPSFDRASLPRWLGMPQEIDPVTGNFKDRLAGFVDVTAIDVSKGYMRAQIGLVYRDGTPEPRDLNDLAGRSLSFQQGTLSGAIVMSQANAETRANAHHHNPGAGFLWEVESGASDLAIVDVAAFDSHLKANPFSTLKMADWRHPIGMDIGIAVTASAQPLLAQINAALGVLLGDGTITALASEVGLTYAPPQSDQLAPAFSLQTLRAGQ